MARTASRSSRSAPREEWDGYACRIPAPGDSRFDRRVCALLSEVYHVAHVPDACRIIEDGRIKAGLIGDESRLRRTRTSVCWLSANYWTPGSIYGAIQFTFRWEDIIRDKEVYWVEVMDYPNPAYRFLITDRDLSGSSLLRPYNPESDRGPLRFRDGNWYWNAVYTSEFMLDTDLSLRRCVEIKSIAHRGDRCRLYGSGCVDASRNIWMNGAQTLAYVMARDLTRARHCFVRRARSGEREPGPSVRDTLGFLLDELVPARVSGPILSRRRSDAVMKGALLLYGAGQFEDAQEVVGTLASAEVAKAALERHARRYLGIPELSLPQR